MNGMKIETQLAQLFNVIMQEMKTNNEFAEKIRGIFNAGEQESDQRSGSRRGRKNREMSTEHADKNAKAIPTSSTSKSRSRKRNPALFNPETILEQHGEETLLDSLNQLEMDQLKDMVSEFGMDPAKKVMKWKKKERFVAHIFEVAHHRVKKGVAFRREN